MKIIKLACIFCVTGMSILLSACGSDDGLGGYYSTGTTGTGIDTTGMIQLTTKPVTSTTGLNYPDPVISGDGSKVLFRSLEDYTGQNADNSYELFVINSDGTGLLQLTDSTSVVSSDPVIYYDISDDGSVIVFDGAFDHLGDGTNSDLGREVFVINADGNGLAQITNGATSGDIAYRPHISGDGSVVSYKKDSTGIYVFNIAGSSETQAVSTNLTYTYSISGNGAKMAFRSDDDLMGTNADGSNEIFIINTDGTGLAQLTNSAVAGTSSREPSISDDGSVIAFISNADLVSGSNLELTSKLFVINSDGTGLGQLIDTGSSLSTKIQMSGDGTSIVFVSASDLTGNNPTFNRSVFLANADGTGIRQVSPDHDSIYESAFPSISNNAGSVVYQSDIDFTGENADHNFELFIDTVL